MRERNRIAQRRYRNRQRFRLQELEQKVTELTERVRTLTSEKVRLDGGPRLWIPLDAESGSCALATLEFARRVAVLRPSAAPSSRQPALRGSRDKVSAYLLAA